MTTVHILKTWPSPYMGNAEQWRYFAEEYPDEGSVGPFTSYGDAVEHAMGEGYDVREPAE